MKTVSGLPVVLAALAAGLLIGGCVQVTRYDVYAPEYLSYDELRTKVVSVGADAAPEMSRTGKIYVKDHYVYVNELYEGVHVIDNSDPADPAVVAFIPIPGNVDIAILGTTLYADSYVDLVAIDIGDPVAAEEVFRIENAFPYNAWWGMWDEYDWGAMYEEVDEEEGIVVGWSYEETRTSVTSAGADYAALDAASGGAESTTGTGGSLARFTIVGDYLYALHGDYIPDPALYVCPTVVHKGGVSRPRSDSFLPDSVCYCYVSGLRSDDDPDYVLAFDEEWNHRGEGIVVAHVGGHVVWERDIDEFHARLEEQRAALAAEGRTMKIIRPTWSRWPERPAYPVRPWHERPGPFAGIAAFVLAILGGVVALIVRQRRAGKVAEEEARA